MAWSKAAKQFPWRIRQGELCKDSGAGELAAGNPNESGRMARTPAYAWLSAFENDKDHDIMEESRVVQSYGGNPDVALGARRPRRLILSFDNIADYSVLLSPHDDDGCRGAGLVLD